MGNSFIDILNINNEFIDRYKEQSNEAIDVIIPLLNSNEFFETNLINWYRQIPIRNLIIGDGGSKDESLEILSNFPRVTILNQSNLKSLGGSIKHMISEVTSDFFIYLHSDVTLPDGWFDIMWKNRKEYDWFECNRKYIAAITYSVESQIKSRKTANFRPLSGSQFGNKRAFENILDSLDDDYLYRQEDIIFADLLKQAGFKYGCIEETFHWHQLTNKRGDLEPNYKSISTEKFTDQAWEIETWTKHLKGLIKYSVPKESYHTWHFDYSLHRLRSLKSIPPDLKLFILENNPEWAKIYRLSYFRSFLRGARKVLQIILNRDFY